MSWLYAKFREELPSYYQKHGRYPMGLQELHIREFGDHSKESMMTNFLYKTDGKAFILGWFFPPGQGQFLRGRSGTNLPDYYP